MQILSYEAQYNSTKDNFPLLVNDVKNALFRVYFLTQIFLFTQIFSIYPTSFPWKHRILQQVPHFLKILLM